MTQIFKQLTSFAWTVLAEARGSRMIATAIGIFMIAWGISLFVGEISITESIQSQAGISASFLRWSILFYLGLFTINSIVRSMNDRMLLLYLSLPVSRLIFIIGIFLGFATLSVFFALGASVLLSLYSDMQIAMSWGLSLMLESWLVIGFAMLCAFGFSHMTLAISAFVCIYILSRMMHGLLLMATQPLMIGEQSLAQSFIETFLTVLDYMLPRLDRFTKADWLMHSEIPAMEISFILQQSLVYLFFLLAMTYFDFLRKDL